MLDTVWTSFASLMQRGGIVMWPLLALSLVAVTLAFERTWFWIRTNSPARVARMRKIAHHLREGDTNAARILLDGDTSVYGRVVGFMLEEGSSDAAIVEALEWQRPRLERFMTTLSTIITAAPLLGILGTVTGIIASFSVFASQNVAPDPQLVSDGIAEALLTTAVGLSVALIALFPYNAFAAQIDRTLSRLEALTAAARRRTDRPSAEGGV